ncbi:MAG: hypothetical protein ACI37T_08565 [Candidatus Gastranaerophilaceae bacterium]
MDFAKSNLFKIFKNESPIGLCSLGLKRNRKKLKNQKSAYPKFFGLDKVTPIGI